MDVQKIVKSHFGPGVVREVEVISDINSDGEAVLNIRVIYDATKASITAEEMTSLTQKLWQAELAKKHSAFPVTSFISTSDVVDYHAAE